MRSNIYFVIISLMLFAPKVDMFLKARWTSIRFQKRVVNLSSVTISDERVDKLAKRKSAVVLGYVGTKYSGYCIH